MADLDDAIPDGVKSLGLYNYYKEPFYLYGDAPDHLFNMDTRDPHFNKSEGNHKFCQGYAGSL